MPAFVVRCACDPGPDGEGGDTVVDHVRLFPLIEGVRWTYRVHEQILPHSNGQGCLSNGQISPCGIRDTVTGRFDPGSLSGIAAFSRGAYRAAGRPLHLV